MASHAVPVGHTHLPSDAVVNPALESDTQSTAAFQAPQRAVRCCFGMRGDRRRSSQLHHGRRVACASDHHGIAPLNGAAASWAPRASGSKRM